MFVFQISCVMAYVIQLFVRVKLYFSHKVRDCSLAMSQWTYLCNIFNTHSVHSCFDIWNKKGLLVNIWSVLVLCTVLDNFFDIFVNDFKMTFIDKILD